MRLTGLYIGVLLCTATNVRAQDTTFKYWIQFRDKENTGYSLENPDEFLSRRAIDRRMQQGIPLTEQDLPVSGVYLDSLREHPLRILYTSKWMNAAVIETTDTGLVRILTDRSFVSEVDYLYRSAWNKKSSTMKWGDPDHGKGTQPGEKHEPVCAQRQEAVSGHQLEMLQGHTLHQDGYQGQGMIIAVLDAGFAHADTLSGFDSLFLNERICGTRNFVEPDSAFFWKLNGTHGTHVLSVMGGEINGVYTGSAPKAGYWLIQTEDIRSEFRIEEANWLAGAELADSAGADIINSSLSYFSGFTDSLHNYGYADMDGATALVSRAAHLAASRGILVVNSAGNLSNPYNPLGYITAPADGVNVLSVGAVDAYGIRADFSARGPSFDGRIKPDVAAQGAGTWLIRYKGSVEQGNGTSYSAPLIAGLAACLWQKNPSVSNQELIGSIRSSASLNPYPDNLLGYGIPNFALADDIISGLPPHESLRDNLPVYPNPSPGYIHVNPGQFAPGRYRYTIYRIDGSACLSREVMISRGDDLRIPVHVLPRGSYLIVVASGEWTGRGMFIKLP